VRGGEEGRGCRQQEIVQGEKGGEMGEKWKKMETRKKNEDKKTNLFFFFLPSKSYLQGIHEMPFCRNVSISTIYSLTNIAVFH